MARQAEMYEIMAAMSRGRDRRHYLAKSKQCMARALEIDGPPDPALENLSDEELLAVLGALDDL